MTQGALEDTQRPWPGVRRDAIFVAIACAICMSMGPAVLLVGTFPLFMEPVSREFSWSAAQFPQLLLINGAMGAFTGPFAGRLMDRRGVRPVLLVGLVAWALSLGALAFLEGSTIRLYIIAAMTGVSAACCGPVALAKVISGWFDRTRGLAMGLILSAAPAAGTVIALTAMQALIPEVGWHQAYLFSALAILVLALPTTFFFLREAPIVERAVGSGEAPELPGMRLMQAIRSRAFWTLLVTAGICCGIASGLSGHLMAWSTERGVDTGMTTVALSAFSLIGPVGSLVSGIAADRLAHPRMLLVFFAMPFLGLLMLFLGGPTLLIPGLILLGLGFAAAAGLTPYLVTRYFGLAYASEILGVSLGLLMLQIGGGPVLVGMAHDALGSYNAIVPFLLVLAAAAAVLAATLPRYNPLFTPPPRPK